MAIHRAYVCCCCYAQGSRLPLSCRIGYGCYLQLAEPELMQPKVMSPNAGSIHCLISFSNVYIVVYNFNEELFSTFCPCKKPQPTPASPWPLNDTQRLNYHDSNRSREKRHSEQCYMLPYSETWPVYNFEVLFFSLGIWEKHILRSAKNFF